MTTPTTADTPTTAEMGGVVPGRVEITARALGAVARAVAAEQLGAPRKRVRVSLSDAGGALGLEVTGPIRLTTNLPKTAVEVAAAIRGTVTGLTGRQVGATRIELTGLLTDPTTRVH